MATKSGRLYLGCAGYQYPDWVGPVYAPGTRSSQMLELYAQYFACLELNFSYYRMPTAETLGRIADRAPSLHFSIKAHQSMTHQRDASREICAAYREAVQPLIDRGQLLACLLQFPYSFHWSPAAMRWLDFLRDALPDLPLVAEFRSREWVRDDVPAALRAAGIGWCAVDEPALPGLMPPVAAATSPVGYVRFHGRNAAQWYDHEHGWQRYDYRYSEAELAGWMPRIQKLLDRTEKTVLILNNHFRGQAVENGQMLADLLPDTLKAELVMPDLEMPRVDARLWRAMPASPDQPRRKQHREGQGSQDEQLRFE